MFRFLMLLSLTALAFALAQCGLDSSSNSALFSHQNYSCLPVSPDNLKLSENSNELKLVEGTQVLSPLNFAQDKAAADKALKIIKEQNSRHYCNIMESGNPAVAFFLAQPRTTQGAPLYGEKCVDVDAFSLQIKANSGAGTFGLYSGSKEIWRTGKSQESAQNVVNMMFKENVVALCRLGSSDTPKSFVYLKRKYVGSSGEPNIPTPTAIPSVPPTTAPTYQPTANVTPTPGVYPTAHVTPTSSPTPAAGDARVTLYTAHWTVSEGSSVTIKWDSYDVSSCLVAEVTESGFEKIITRVETWGAHTTGALYRDTRFVARCKVKNSSQYVTDSAVVSIRPDNFSCQPGYEEFQGNCLRVCPAGAFRNQHGGCTSNCSGNTELFEGRCVPRCPSGYARDAFGGCSGSCTSNEEMYLGRCMPRCPNGTFRNQYGNCGVCEAGREVVGNECLLICTGGTFRNEYGNCGTCSGDNEVVGNVCLRKCNVGYHRAPNGTCVRN